MRLKELRKNKGLSQEKLAKKLGIGQTSIANYESNRRIPSLEVFIAISQEFNVSLDYLAGNIEEINDNKFDEKKELSTQGKKYLSLLLEGKKNESINYILDLCDNGWKNKKIYEDIFIPTLNTVGHMWEKMNLSVSEEHFISNTTLEIISNLHSQVPISKTNKGKIMMTTVTNEEHIIGLKIMENILEENEYGTYFLGGKTSAKHLVKSIQLQKPDVVIISITLEKFVLNLEQMIQKIKSNYFQDIKILITGQGLLKNSDLVYRFGADAYGKDLDDVLNIIKSWV